MFLYILQVIILRFILCDKIKCVCLYFLFLALCVTFIEIGFYVNLVLVKLLLGSD